MLQDIHTRVDLLERKVEEQQEQLNHLFSLLENDEFVEKIKMQLNELQEQIDDLFSQIKTEG
jgi:peptidoglycan hydrolase CwlO-like protein